MRTSPYEDDEIVYANYPAAALFRHIFAAILEGMESFVPKAKQIVLGTPSEINEDQIFTITFDTPLRFESTRPIRTKSILYLTRCVSSPPDALGWIRQRDRDRSTPEICFLSEALEAVKAFKFTDAPYTRQHFGPNEVKDLVVQYLDLFSNQVEARAISRKHDNIENISLTLLLSHCAENEHIPYAVRECFWAEINIYSQAIFHA